MGGFLNNRSHWRQWEKWLKMNLWISRYFDSRISPSNSRWSCFILFRLGWVDWSALREIIVISTFRNTFGTRKLPTWFLLLAHSNLLFANQPTLFSPSLVHLESGFDLHPQPPLSHWSEQLIVWFPPPPHPPLLFTSHSGRCAILNWKSSRYRIKYLSVPPPHPTLVDDM